MARLGSEKGFIGPEPFCGVPDCTLKLELRRWELKEVMENWNATNSSRHAKRFIIPGTKPTKK